MKNKKNICKISCLLIIICLIIFVPAIKVNATEDVFKGADNFLELGKDTDMLDDYSIKSVSDKLFGIFSIFGTVTVVIVGAVLGVQFIVGSTAEKAEVKERLFPYIIGSIVIFGAMGIWLLVLEVLTDITK